ncbi:MAG: Tryptophan-tRNA ligase [Candidatus Magasanikbacteria bacterium GW2011_GWC2_40_17]|uniref:Tryptophan--tRNA ligase n=1 Tax=Candidatus Magasanikbacteria bacterium GW2011_GWA2_42_32 TaxID=1619039 RepID=A0A0G1A8C3_9BACT|nr:MAG: Tryptophan-tRNA ligase [Candidatus Magasanikbacteria bacterium GW2011_GWC2_40_17]KKS57307.1 MAG: Tryptophan-tRNA ligase [Candidatus Magasanikbacteria bacterium GW2011_GWA2_42_32]OGH85791.1 MAG: tryptophan--tRNA ligase [Candidatus Magasanikbacteria bacterium RIFOXYB2_FULL_38_10]
MQRLLSGIKPTGDIHLGNYFGAMRQFLDLQNEFDSFIFIADYHALNQLQNAKELSKNILEIAKAYLAIGLNPDKVTLFKQSDVPEVTELAWIFNCLTPIAELQRAHAYKDAMAKKLPVNMGLFDYPVLMAADILMYNSDVVPVGADQKQHLEVAQDMAKKFNKVFGEIFKVPQERILEGSATVPGLDGRKMSKSYKNTIGLFDSEKDVLKKVMTIKTDSKGASEPKDTKTDNIFSLHKLFATPDELKELERAYKEGQISYKESKELLGERINNFLQPLREKKLALDANEKMVKEILVQGAGKARNEAQAMMKRVREKIGVKN